MILTEGVNTAMIQRVLSGSRHVLLQALDVARCDLCRVLKRPVIRPQSWYGAWGNWLEVASASNSATRPKDGYIAIHVLRNRHWAYWAAYWACRLHTAGHQIVLVYSKTETERFLRLRPGIDIAVSRFWNSLLNNKVFPTIDLDLLAQAHTSILPAVSGELEQQAKIQWEYDHGKGHTKLGHESDDIDQLASASERCARGTLALLNQFSVGRAILPSGMIGTSAGILAAYQEAGVPVVTVEGWGARPGHVIWNSDAPAVEFGFRHWFEAFGQLSNAQEAIVDQYLAFQEDPQSGRTEHFSDYRAAQPTSVADSGAQQAVGKLSHCQTLTLLGTNVLGDSSTLGKETLFESQRLWLETVLQWFRKNPAHGLLIRVHPEEELNRPLEFMGKVIRPLIAGLENVVLIDANDAFNTFSIVDTLSLGLVWISHLGVDLAARGVPVISAAHSHYFGLGIAHEPNSVDEYLELLEMTLQSGRTETNPWKLAARKYLYVLTTLLSLPGWPSLDSTAVPTTDDCFNRLHGVLTGALSRQDLARVV
jgi:hypothetical protein